MLIPNTGIKIQYIHIRMYASNEKMLIRYWARKHETIMPNEGRLNKAIYFSIEKLGNISFKRYSRMKCTKKI